MIVFGVIFLLVGWMLGVSFLTTFGTILLIVGVVLLLLGVVGGGPVAGRRWYY